MRVRTKQPVYGFPCTDPEGTCLLGWVPANTEGYVIQRGKDVTLVEFSWTGRDSGKTYTGLVQVSPSELEVVCE